MPTPSDAQDRARAAYNAAADHYDDAANAFWARFGGATIDRLTLAPGSAVLDVCCGSGASAIPAAMRTGPTGRVLAVDLAANLVTLGRAKAQGLGLTNIEFRIGDMLDLGLPDASFDAVVCVFGIFFLPDTRAAVRELWRMLRPAGALALTTWGPRLFEPANAFFWESVRNVRPDLYRGFRPWDSLCTVEAVEQLIAQSVGARAEVVAEPATHPIARPEDWWTIILGTGYRATIEKLTLGERARVREANLEFMARERIRAVETNTLYAAARKP